VAHFGPNAGEGGIWMAGGGLSVDAATNLFFAIGNGSFNATNSSGGTEYGDSFIRLSTAGALAVADYFTPYNQQFLADNNVDIGSGGLALLPDQPGPFPHLMLGGGKEGKVYLINRDMMTAGNNHYNAGGTTDAVVQTISLGGGVFDTPAWFNGNVYFAASGDVLAFFSLQNGRLSTLAVSTGPRQFAYPGATPTVSARGASNGIIWAINRANPAVLTAYNATNLTTEIYNSSQAGGRDVLANGVKFAVPTVANGKVYVGAQNALSVFGLFTGGNPLPSPYENWKTVHFGANANNPNIAGNSADPDHDHIVNLLEYAHATDPNAPDVNRGISGSVISNHFQIQFRQNVSASDLKYVAQAAAALGGGWTDLMTCAAAGNWVANTTGATASQSSSAGSPPDQYVTVTIRDPVTVGSPQGVHRFFQVIVQQLN
jgi:hypothetical protein